MNCRKAPGAHGARNDFKPHVRRPDAQASPRRACGSFGRTSLAVSRTRASRRGRRGGSGCVFNALQPAGRRQYDCHGGRCGSDGDRAGLCGGLCHHGDARLRTRCTQGALFGAVVCTLHHACHRDHLFGGQQRLAFQSGPLRSIGRLFGRIRLCLASYSDAAEVKSGNHGCEAPGGGKKSRRRSLAALCNRDAGACQSGAGQRIHDRLHSDDHRLRRAENACGRLSDACYRNLCVGGGRAKLCCSRAFESWLAHSGALGASSDATLFSDTDEGGVPRQRTRAFADARCCSRRSCLVCGRCGSAGDRRCDLWFLHYVLAVRNAAHVGQLRL